MRHILRLGEAPAVNRAPPGASGDQRDGQGHKAELAPLSAAQLKLLKELVLRDGKMGKAVALPTTLSCVQQNHPALDAAAIGRDAQSGHGGWFRVGHGS